MAELLALQRGETVGTFTEVHRFRRDHHLHTRRSRDHVAALTTRSTSRSHAGSTLRLKLFVCVCVCLSCALANMRDGAVHCGFSVLDLHQVMRVPFCFGRRVRVACCVSNSKCAECKLNLVSRRRKPHAASFRKGAAIAIVVKGRYSTRCQIPRCNGSCMRSLRSA